MRTFAAKVFAEPYYEFVQCSESEVITILKGIFKRSLSNSYIDLRINVKQILQNYNSILKTKMYL